MSVALAYTVQLKLQSVRVDAITHYIYAVKIKIDGWKVSPLNVGVIVLQIVIVTSPL